MQSKLKLEALCEPQTRYYARYENPHESNLSWRKVKEEIFDSSDFFGTPDIILHSSRSLLHTK